MPDRRAVRVPVAGLVRVVALLALLAMAAGSAGAAPGTRDAVDRYGDAAPQFRQWWLPAGDGPLPTVVLIHGGCWVNAWDTATVEPLAAALRAAGFVVVVPEYRRIGDPGGGWPGTFADIALAFDSLLASAHGRRVDPARISVAGHSAGGHLALWLAARAALDPAHPLAPRGGPPIAQVVGLGAITDLAAYAAGHSGCEQATRQLLGGGPDTVPDRYAAASPVALAASARAPLAGVAVTLVTGTADTIVPAAQATALVAASGSDPATGPVIHRPVAGADHFDLIRPEGEAFEVLRAVLAAPVESPSSAPSPPPH